MFHCNIALIHSSIIASTYTFCLVRPYFMPALCDLQQHRSFMPSCMAAGLNWSYTHSWVTTMVAKNFLSQPLMVQAVISHLFAIPKTTSIFYFLESCDLQGQRLKTQHHWWDSVQNLFLSLGFKIKRSWWHF